MTARHVKTEISMGPTEEHANGWGSHTDVAVWSSGPPGKEVQLKIGDRTRLVNAADLIDAVRRCSDR